MAELNAFHYLPKTTLLHIMDSRVKLVSMFMFTITTSFASNPMALFVLTGLFTVLLILAKLPVYKSLMEMRYFLFLIFIVVFVHALTIPGTSVPFFPKGIMTWEGLKSGVFYGWKIILILLLCSILTATTTISSLRNAIERMLRPVPFISESVVATMFSLVFVFIPLLFDKAAEISEAQKARCIEARRNPVRRLSYLTIPFLRRTLLYADEVVHAMEARCYTGIRTAPIFCASYGDWLSLLFSLVVCSLIFLWF